MHDFKWCWYDAGHMICECRPSIFRAVKLQRWRMLLRLACPYGASFYQSKYTKPQPKNEGFLIYVKEKTPSSQDIQGWQACGDREVNRMTDLRQRRVTYFYEVAAVVLQHAESDPASNGYFITVIYERCRGYPATLSAGHPLDSDKHELLYTFTIKHLYVTEMCCTESWTPELNTHTDYVLDISWIPKCLLLTLQVLFYTYTLFLIILLHHSLGEQHKKQQQQ